MPLKLPRFVCLLGLCLPVLAALGAEKPLPLVMTEALAMVPPAPPPVLYSDLSAGYVKTNGNADTTSLNATVLVVFRSLHWENTFNAGAIDARSAGVTTTEQYDVTDKLLYNLAPDAYVFTEVDYGNDRFAGVAERDALSAGYGRHVINTPTQTLDMDAGLGVNHTRQQFTNDYQTHLIATAGGAYLWQITGNCLFKQTLRTEFSDNNIFIDPISQLKLNIVGKLFATLNYELRYNTSVPAGTFHSDQTTSVNLGYTLGNKPKS